MNFPNVVVADAVDAHAVLLFVLFDVRFIFVWLVVSSEGLQFPFCPIDLPSVLLSVFLNNTFS